MTQKTFSLSVATAVGFTTSPHGELGCNAEISLCFQWFQGLNEQWVLLKQQIIKSIDHQHLGYNKVITHGEPDGHWQILRAIEESLKVHPKTMDHWISTRLSIGDTQDFFQNNY